MSTSEIAGLIARLDMLDGQIGDLEREHVELRERLARLQFAQRFTENDERWAWRMSATVLPVPVVVVGYSISAGRNYVVNVLLPGGREHGVYADKLVLREVQPKPQVSGVQHAPRLCRKERGRSPLSGRSVYGWDSGCVCGWTYSSNEDKRAAQRLYKQHLKDVSKEVV